MAVLICAEGLGKRYVLKGKEPPQNTLRDALTFQARQLISRALRSNSLSGAKSLNREEFWALREASFEIHEGERVGIIGRNGAGKSTLLKILSRITEPSTGHVQITGRVASLLEVGTGFHPELTGRENIYLNGAILGMRKLEIKQRFDEIVAFSEVERFLDTPLKHYSSGMYVRLAFAVAAHLEPDILIVDEVLAVGDAQFQKKCLTKMNEVGDSGRTVLFVSHNMHAVEQLCTSALLLEKGKIRERGADVQKIVRRYIFSEDSELASIWQNPGHEFDNPWFRPTRFFLADADGRPARMPVRNDADVWVHLEGVVKELDPALTVGYALYAGDGMPLYWSYQTDAKQELWPNLKLGINTLRSQIPKRLLNEGDYRLEMLGGLHFRKWLFEPGKNCPSVFLRIAGALSDSPHWMVRRPGTLAPVLDWEAI
jgi:lipopolysaccharide transport system ATP-binding protein